MIGQLLIHALFGLSVVTTVLYALAYFRRNPSLAGAARQMFGLIAICLVACASMLVVNIIQHRFDYTYVYSYSSTELPLHLLIASFYSGQEGSFLLWTMLVSIIGVVLLPYARKQDYEAPMMMFYGLILCFLTLLLVAKNPFAYYYETFAAQGISVADVPNNGRGLNPLLHNAWITIHPPILFTGFAAMSVSFVFAMAGLIKRDYHRWITVALPWTLLATAVLGFGIMLGGFWAYETLGWGGFWGWDPVENSSLIPWLVSVALVHTMLVQKRTRGLVKTNMILAVLAFVMVLYSTFLTRSGILGDTSVHSFVDPGKFAFWILLAFMLTFTVIGLWLILSRRSDMNVQREDFSPRTREFMLSIGAALVMASAVFVTIGTSWPVIMEVIGQPKVAVSVDFYNKVHIILVPAILIVNALSLLLQWRSTPGSLFRRRVLTSGVVAIAATAVAAVLGIRDVVSLVLMVSAWFALVVNAQMGWNFAQRSPAMLGAYVSHLGIALLIFGVITTANYTEAHHAMLPQDVPTKVGDFTLTYLGSREIDTTFKDRRKMEYLVRIERDGAKAMVAPVLYWSDFNKRQSPFLEPGIRWGLMNDLYVSPKAEPYMDGISEAVTIQRSGTIRVPVDTTRTLTLERFTMPMEEGAAQDGRMQMAAMLVATDAGGRRDTIKALTRITMGENGPGFDPVWASIPGTTIGVGLVRIERNNADPSKSLGDLVFRDVSKDAREVFTVEFSVKPFISLVWFGVITMVAGFAFSIVRYLRLSKQQGALAGTDLTPRADGKVSESEHADTNAEQT